MAFARPSTSRDIIVLIFSLLVVAADVFCSLRDPIVGYPADSIFALDGVWRLVQGQVPGSDYYNPLGVGYFGVAAIFWRTTHDPALVLPLTTGAFSAVIVLCGWYVAVKRLPSFTWQLLFCVIVACIASAPFIYGNPPRAFGQSLFYNRLTFAALAVLFLQNLTLRREDEEFLGYGEAALAAFLLDLLYLIKISHVVIGALLILAGALMQGRSIPAIVRGLARLAIAFAILLALDFVLFGGSPIGLLRDYRLAAGARSHGMFGEVARLAFQIPLLLSAFILFLDALSIRRDNAWPVVRAMLVVVAYFGCQLAQNAVNSAYTIYLAPIAAIALAQLRLGFTSQARPFATTLRDGVVVSFLAAMILVPHLIGLGEGALAAVGKSPSISAPVTVSAGRGTALRFAGFLPEKGVWGAALDYADGLADGVKLLQAQNVTGPIATLDFSNPFPLLLQSVSPKGVALWWHPGVDIAEDHLPDFLSPIGDACAVMIPVHPYQFIPEATALLVRTARAQLASDFDLSVEDNLWRLYQRHGGCHPAS